MMRAILLALVVCLGACASTEEVDRDVDPFENFNRTMFNVNRFGDKIIYKPFGKAYKAVIPSLPARASIISLTT